MSDSKRCCETPPTSVKVGPVRTLPRMRPPPRRSPGPCSPWRAGCRAPRRLPARVVARVAVAREAAETSISATFRNRLRRFRTLSRSDAYSLASSSFQLPRKAPVTGRLPQIKRSGSSLPGPLVLPCRVEIPPRDARSPVGRPHCAGSRLAVVGSVHAGLLRGAAGPSAGGVGGHSGRLPCAGAQIPPRPRRRSAANDRAERRVGRSRRRGTPGRVRRARPAPKVTVPAGPAPPSLAPIRSRARPHAASSGQLNSPDAARPDARATTSSCARRWSMPARLPDDHPGRCWTSAATPAGRSARSPATISTTSTGSSGRPGGRRLRPEIDVLLAASRGPSTARPPTGRGWSGRR